MLLPLQYRCRFAPGISALGRVLLLSLAPTRCYSGWPKARTLHKERLPLVTLTGITPPIIYGYVPGVTHLVSLISKGKDPQLKEFFTEKVKKPFLRTTEPSKEPYRTRRLALEETHLVPKYCQLPFLRQHIPLGHGSQLYIWGRNLLPYTLDPLGLLMSSGSTKNKIK